MARLVSTSELAAHVDDPAWIVFDCRHDLVDHNKGRQQYDAGHIPGAFFAPVETALAGSKTGANGRHPLPDRETFAAFLAQHGVAPGRLVVAYDDAGGLYAARLWWMCRWIGFEAAALLDGGITKWSAEGRPLSRAQPRPPAGDVKSITEGPEPVQADQILRSLGKSELLVVDARAAERFRGEVEPMDRVAGHIPGAVNRFYRANLNADLTFRAPGELKAEFLQLLQGRSPEQVVHQCGSGITACANLFAMELAGLHGSRLYAGSWSEWSSDPSRPVARGSA